MKKVGKPEITDIIGGYIYEWKAEQVQIQVDHIKSHTDGSVTGEITVTSLNPVGGGLLHRAGLNFSADRTRVSLANKLNKRVPLDWDAVIEQLCFNTLEKVRSGEPVQELWSGEEAKPPDYLLHPIIIRNYPTVIFGDPGSTKSNLAVILAQILLLPWKDNPLGLTAPDRSIKTLFLDWETDAETIRWQLTRLQRGMGLGPIALNYRRCSLPLAQDVEQVRQHIVSTEAELIIIDSLGLACGGELKEAQPALAFFTALRQLKATSLTLAHTAKNNMEGPRNKSIYGSVFFEAQSRSVWEARKVGEAGDDEIDVALFHRKAPPFGKLQTTIGMKIEFGPDTMKVSKQDATSVKEFVSNMGASAQIKDVLKHGAMTAVDIAQETGLSKGTVDGTLARMKAKQQAVKTEGFKWGLVIG